MKKKVEPLQYDIKLSEAVYWKLVELKFKRRTRSIDEVLRVLLDMPENHARVKIYSHERCRPGQSDDGDSLSSITGSPQPTKISLVG